jgi:hypothetical protein
MDEGRHAMLIDEFKRCYGKSTGALSLYDHVIGSTVIAKAVLDKFGGVYPDYPKSKKDMLIFATFTHDLGKLDTDFQAMLCAVIAGKPMPPKRVKHEASTLDYVDLLENGQGEVYNVLNDELHYVVDSKIDLEMALAFAVSHHGLFYMAYEATVNYGNQWLIRREWTTRPSREIKRITLVDLLFMYHPFGGLVMISDLIHSFCHEKGIDYRYVLENSDSYKGLIDSLICKADELEATLNRSDPRGNRSLASLLRLLLGEIK